MNCTGSLHALDSLESSGHHTAAMEEAIEREVQAIAALAVEHIGSAVRSILWYGGFARGEGGLYDDRGRRLPFGDYDLEIVCDSLPDAATRRRLRDALVEYFGYRLVTEDPAPTWRDGAEEFNVVDLHFSQTARFAERPADLATYDLVHSSRVVWGEDLRGTIPLRLQDVSPISAFRIVNNRLLALLPVAKARLWAGDGTFQEYVAYALALTRLTLDLGTALSFGMGCYAISYHERLAHLARCRVRIDREVGPARPLLDLLAQATAFKHNPVIVTEGEAARTLWFDTLEQTWRVLSWLGWQLLLSPGTRQERYAAELYRRLPGRYYRHYLEQALRTYLPVGARTVARCGAWLPNVVEHVRWRGWGFVLQHPLAAWRSPAVRACCAVPLLLYALDGDGRVDAAKLRRARDLVCVYGVQWEAGDSLAHWDAAREVLGRLLVRYRAEKGTFRTLRRQP